MTEPLTPEQMALAQALADTTHSQAGEALDALLVAYKSERTRREEAEAEEATLREQLADAFDTINSSDAAWVKQREDLATRDAQLLEANARHAAAHENWMASERLAAEWVNKYEARDAQLTVVTARVIKLEQAVFAAEWSGDPGTDSASFVCPFCGCGHSEAEWATGTRDHGDDCIVRTIDATLHAQPATPLDPSKCPHPSVTCARCWTTWTP